MDMGIDVAELFETAAQQQQQQRRSAVAHPGDHHAPPPLIVQAAVALEPLPIEPAPVAVVNHNAPSPCGSSTVRIHDLLNGEDQGGGDADASQQDPPVHAVQGYAEQCDQVRLQWNHSVDADIVMGMRDTEHHHTRADNGSVPFAAAEAPSQWGKEIGGYNGGGGDVPTIRDEAVGTTETNKNEAKAKKQPPENPAKPKQKTVDVGPASRNARAFLLHSASPPSSTKMQASGNASSHSSVVSDRPMNSSASISRSNNWTSEEEALFESAFALHGRKWKLISDIVKTRSATQVRSYAQKYLKMKAADSLLPAGNGGTMTDMQRFDADHRDPISSIAVAALAVEATEQQAGKKLLDSSVAVEDNVTVEVAPQQQPRRTARQGKKTLKVREMMAMNALDVPSPSPPVFKGIDVVDFASRSSSCAENSIIEIYTEESAGDTPEKKVPIRSKRRAQRPTWATYHQIASPQQKKPKILVARNAAESIASVSPSGSVASFAKSISALSSATSSKASPARGKKRRQHPEAHTSAVSSGEDGRSCDFCRKTQGVCATMHCSACRRAYHARCFVNHFRPHCSTDEPIDKQLEALQLNPPDNVRVKIFRCVPCHAAFIEFFNRGGYEWDCECPSCREPEKLVAYRREMLLKMIFGEDAQTEKKSKTPVQQAPTKAEEEDSAPSSEAPKRSALAASKRAALVSTRTGARRRDSAAATASNASEPMVVDSEAAASRSTKDEEAKDAGMGESVCVGDDNARPAATLADRGSESGDKSDPLDGDAHAEQESATLLPATEHPASIHDDKDEEDEKELSDEELLAAVTIKFDSGRDCFDVVCTDTPSGTPSGKTKHGLFFAEERDAEGNSSTVYCNCCSKDLTIAQFVHHTGGNYLDHQQSESGAPATTNPSDFIFVCHRDGTGLSPLNAFLKVFRRRNAKPKNNEHATSSHPLKPNAEKKDAPNAGGGAMTLDDAWKQMESSVILKRIHPWPRSASSSGKPPVYVIKVVCLPSKLTIPRPDGLVRSKVDPSNQGYFPYKEGWLAFDVGVAGDGPLAKPPMYSCVLCGCCQKELMLDDFITHALQEPWEKKFKRRFVYVPQVDDERILIELEKIWQSILALHLHQRLDTFLKQKCAV